MAHAGEFQNIHFFSSSFFLYFFCFRLPTPSRLFPSPLRFTPSHRFKPFNYISLNPNPLVERVHRDQQRPDGRVHYRDAPLAAVAHGAFWLAGHRAQPARRRPRYRHPGGVTRDDKPSPGLYEVNRRLEFLGSGKLLGCFRSSECKGGRSASPFLALFLLLLLLSLTLSSSISIQNDPNTHRDQREDLQKRLKELLKALRKAKLVCGRPLVIKARVPIIKCELTFGVAVDISLGAVNGAAAVEYIQAQVIWG